MSDRIPDCHFRTPLLSRLHNRLIQLVVGKRKGVIMNVQLGSNGIHSLEVVGDGSLMCHSATFFRGIVIIPKGKQK